MAKSRKKTTKRRRTALKKLSVGVKDMPARRAERVKGGRSAQITLT